MQHKTKVMDWGKRYCLGDLYDDSRLAGFEVAIVESGIRGARMNLVASPPWVEVIESEGSGQVSSTRE